MSLMAVDPGVTTGICVTNNTFAGQKFDQLVHGLSNVRDANMGPAGKNGKMMMRWGEITVQTELVPGTFVAWFQIGPCRTVDQEYWLCVLMADLVELCGVQHLAIEDFILRGHDGRMGGVGSGRDGLAAVRIIAMMNAVLRDRRLIVFSGMRGGRENRFSQRSVMRVGKADGCLVHMQQPSMAKSAFTDDRIRRAGLWVVGHPHARDAMRHLCLLWRAVEGTRRVRGNPGVLEKVREAEERTEEGA